MDAGDVKRWMRARGLAEQLTRESFAKARLSAADAFGAACGLMDVTSAFRPSGQGPDQVRQRDERETHAAWEHLHQRYLTRQR